VGFVSPFLENPAVAVLFDRHGRDVFNVCLRVTGSREAAATATGAAFLQRPPEHGARVALLAAARRESARPAAPPGAADRPPRGIGEANARLDVDQREVLALRELAGCSYREIAQIVGADREAVAELLWKARLALRDQLAGSSLLSIASLAASCRRALGLMVMSWDGELHDAGDRTWLQRHVRNCGKCRLSQESLRQASASYREWPPSPTPLGMRESLLEAAALMPADEPAERPAAVSEK
jgi:predicted DNA-binding protein (UPF0251 family)